LRIDGELDVRLFENSWQLIVAHHEILENIVSFGGTGKSLQIVHRQVALPFQQHDWSNLASTEQESRFGIVCACGSSIRIRFLAAAADAPRARSSGR